MLQKLVPHNARVLRDGGEVVIPTTELVPRNSPTAAEDSRDWLVSYSQISPPAGSVDPSVPVGASTRRMPPAG